MPSIDRSGAYSFCPVWGGEVGVRRSRPSTKVMVKHEGHIFKRNGFYGGVSVSETQFASY